jgi:hypothetical protein
LISCVTTPLRIAFAPESGKEEIEWEVIENFIDVCFGIDIITVFNSAFYNSEYLIVEDRWLIAADYCKSWFLIDFISIFPIESFV